MKDWFSSLTGVIVLSFAALLAHIARTFLDFQFVYAGFASSTSLVALGVIINVAFIGGWMVSLHLAAKGRKSGLIVNLVFIILLPISISIATMMTLCPTPCQTAGGLMEIVNWLNLITGLLAALAVALYLGRTKKA